MNKNVPIGEYFKKIYEKDEWGCGSGIGSLEPYTRKYRKILQDILEKRNIRSVLDIGCGDWQLGSLIDWPEYTGIDIVSSVVNNLKKKYPYNFICGNALKMILPQADLLILKDVMQHWLPSEIISFVPKIKEYKFALITNDISVIDESKLHERWHPVIISDYGLKGELVLQEQVFHTYKATYLLRK